MFHEGTDESPMNLFFVDAGVIFRGDEEIADARADASSGRVIARTLVEQRFRKNTRTKGFLQ